MSQVKAAIVVSLSVIAFGVIAWYALFLRPELNCFDRIRHGFINDPGSASLISPPIVRRAWLFSDAPGLIELHMAYQHPDGAKLSGRFYCSIGRTGGLWGISDAEPQLLPYSKY
jgi:hypothetical protein